MKTLVNAQEEGEDPEELGGGGGRTKKRKKEGQRVELSWRRRWVRGFTRVVRFEFDRYHDVESLSLCGVVGH
jgi:hypothetical protein